MVVYTLRTSLMRVSSTRAASAVAIVSLSVEPGGSSRYTWVCELSSGGMKPVGNSGISITEPTKNAMAPAPVMRRCLRHQLAHAR